MSSILSQLPHKNINLLPKFELLYVSQQPIIQKLDVLRMFLRVKIKLKEHLLLK